MKPDRVVTATHFKTHCLKLLENVRRSRQTLLVTRHGKPVAEISPPASRVGSATALKGSILHQGDLVSPVGEKWESAS